MTAPRIALDAHAHLWTRERTPQPWIDPVSMAAIDRDFAVDDLAAVQRANGIGGAIVVQSANSAQETRDLLDAADNTTVRGVVGWVDLESDVTAALDDLAARGPLVGVRHLAHQDPDPEWLGRPGVGRGLDALGARGLPFDLVVLPGQLHIAAQTAAAHPGTRFVLDHLGKPPIASGDLADWRRDLARIAARDNVVAKVSGLAIEGDWASWTVDDLRAPVDHALDVFGAGRLMFGTDWPLALVTGGTASWVAAFDEIVHGLSEAERAALTGGTAATTYLGGADA